MNQVNKYRVDLQFLRGISVILVLFYHLGVPGFDNGYLGVDIFFVLSGFLMAMLTDKFEPVEFYKRRMKRLVPAYLVTIIVTTLVVILVAVPTDSDQRLDRIWFDFFGLSNIAFWLENSYLDSSAFKPLLNLWSLGIEIQFYLIAPFILPILKRYKVALILSIFGSLIISLVILTVSPKTSFFMLPTRIWEFLVGSYSAWFIYSLKVSKVKSLIGVLSLISLLLVIVFYPLNFDSLSIITGHPGIASVLVVVATAFYLITKMEDVNSFKHWITKFFIKIGDYSYSIYLTHFPIIVLINYTPFGGTILGHQSILHLIVILGITAIASYFMFNYVETLRYKKNIFFPLVVLILIGVTVGVWGTNFNKVNYSIEELKIFNAWKDRSPYRCGKISRIISPLETTCLLNKGVGDKKVLLLGNSHADSIKVAFTDSISKYNISTYFFVANNPLMSNKTSAKDIYNDIIDYEIGSVVIHYSPSFYSSTKNINLLNEFLNLMYSIDVSVFFIAPVPIFDIHVPKTMLKMINDPNNKSLDKNLDDYFLSSNDFFQFVYKNDIDNGLVSLPHTILCPSGKCLFQKKGIPFYFDSFHLTLTGAQNLTPIFDNIAKKIKK